MKKVTHSFEGLQLNGRRRGAGAILLGAIILLVCVILMLGRNSLKRESATFAERIAAAESERRATAAMLRANESEQLSEAAALQLGRQIRLINRDWSRLLSTLVPESEETRLLSIDVEPVTGSIRISGTSDSAERANAYSALLEARAIIHDVRLMSLERDGARIVFEVTAQWAD